jgi:hypothetical protein
MMTPKGGAIVDIELSRYPAHQKRFSEGIQKTLQLLMKVKLSMGYQSTVVVKESDQIGLLLLAADLDIRAMHNIALP